MATATDSFGTEISVGHLVTLTGRWVVEGIITEVKPEGRVAVAPVVRDNRGMITPPTHETAPVSLPSSAVTVLPQSRPRGLCHHCGTYRTIGRSGGLTSHRDDGARCEGTRKSPEQTVTDTRVVDRHGIEITGGTHVVVSHVGRAGGHRGIVTGYIRDAGDVAWLTVDLVTSDGANGWVSVGKTIRRADLVAAVPR